MKLRNVSASQVSNFRRCKRKWYFDSILKLRPKEKTPAQQRGIDIHKEVEHYLKTGVVRDSKYEVPHDDGTVDVFNYRRYIEALAPHLPPPMHPELIIEHKFRLVLPNGLPPWDGYIDQGISLDGGIKLYDVKSTSDLRYAKTPAELLVDTQLNSYAYWGITEGHDGSTEYGHVYVKTEKRKVPTKPKTKEVFVDASKDHVLSRWESELEVVREMVQTAEAESVLEVEATGAPFECQAFGGCPHRMRCGLGAEQSITKIFGNKKRSEADMANNFLTKLKEKNGGKNGNSESLKVAQNEAKVPAVSGKKPAFLGKKKVEEVEEVEEVAEKSVKKAKKPAFLQKPNFKVEEGILPPDASSRETPIKAAEEPTEDNETEKKTRGRPKGSKNTKVINGARAGFVLYVDCAPTRGDIEPTLFEDWISSIVTDLNVEVQSEKGLADYRFLPYSEEKAALAYAMAARLDGLQAMIISSASPKARDAMEVLVPNAAQVVRAFR